MSTISSHSGPILISSESFQDIDNPQRVKKYFKEYEVTIIVYLREQLEYLLSAYAQKVHATKTKHNLEIFQKKFDPNYSIFLKKWEKAFGKENIKVRLYDRGKLINANIVDDFIDAAELPKDIEYKQKIRERNPSLGEPLVIFKHILNNISPLNELELREKIYKLLANIAKNNQKFQKKPQVNQSVAKKNRKKYQKSNASIAKKYFNKSELFNHRDFSNTPQNNDDLHKEFLKIFKIIEKTDKEFVNLHFDKVMNFLKKYNKGC